jgi:hypothetical protein
MDQDIGRLHEHAGNFHERTATELLALAIEANAGTQLFPKVVAHGGYNIIFVPNTHYNSGSTPAELLDETKMIADIKKKAGDKGREVVKKIVKLQDDMRRLFDQTPAEPPKLETLIL